MRNRALEVLKEVIDPHTGMNLVDMGVVQHVEADEEEVYVSLKPTSPFCPITDYLVNAVREKLKDAGFKKIEVELEDALS